MSSPQLVNDAANRAVRSLYQGLGIDVLVGVGLVLSAWIVDADITSKQAWTVLGLSVAKSVIQAVAAFFMRLKLDQSFVPTPTATPNPEVPEDVEPADPAFR